MRNIDFDYPNTCPKIDKEINKAKAEIESFLDNLLDEACPLLETNHRKRLASDNANALYGALEGIFEETRSANEDMRSEADSQIRALKQEIAELERQVES